MRIITARPATIKIRSYLTGRAKDAYNLTWVLVSYARLEEVRILYRKRFPVLIVSYKPYLLIDLFEILIMYNVFCYFQNDTLQQPDDPTNPWHDIILGPPVYREQVHEHPMSHVIRGLEPSSLYEVLIQGKNKFGWNAYSEAYTFRTHTFTDFGMFRSHLWLCNRLNANCNYSCTYVFYFAEITEPDMRDLELTANNSCGRFLPFTFHLLISTVFIIKFFCMDFFQ